MKTFSLFTRLYLFAIYLAGISVLFVHLHDMRFSEPWLLAVLCVLASLALILRVEGSNSRSHYTFSFVVYGFTFSEFGAGTAILVIGISHLVEWIWYRSPWYLQFFNMGTYLVVTEVAGLVYSWIQQSTAMISEHDILALILGMAIFAVFNHALRGFLLWSMHRQNFMKSGVLDFFPLVLDVSLLYFGASLAIVWRYNPFAIVLFIIPTYLLYRALRIPALERKTELDSKTGLFNHAYFKKQLDSELARSKRFDRPLSVIIADLDLLRNINNTYGHLAGDEVLIGVATAMKRSVREYDVVSRFGGEEFAILLPETTLEQAYEKAEFFRKAIEAMEFT
ncbi:MAG: diguanylate cyclase, partial [Syntrophothermus sp.]